MDDLTKRPLSRRDALKALAGITGAVAISSLPNKWSTPLVDVGALPAFAQCSPTASTAALEVFNNTPCSASVSINKDESTEILIDSMSSGRICGILPGEGGWEYSLESPCGDGDGEGITWEAGVLVQRQINLD